MDFDTMDQPQAYRLLKITRNATQREICEAFEERLNLEMSPND
jgi:hypothetical protein